MITDKQIAEIEAGLAGVSKVTVTIAYRPKNDGDLYPWQTLIVGDTPGNTIMTEGTSITDALRQAADSLEIMAVFGASPLASTPRNEGEQ